MPTSAELFDLDRVPAPLRSLLAPERPWEVLAALDGFVAAVEDGRAGTVHPTAIVEGPVHLAAGAAIGPFAWVRGPAWIGRDAQVGHGALLRGGCVLADGATVGHASEVKRSLLLAGAAAPHFAYVGDSVLGSGVNLGAGTKLANVKTGGTVRVDGQDTGLRKLGSLIGDDVFVGCNAVLAPGTIVGRRTVIYAGAVVRGTMGPDRIVKHRPVVDVVERTDAL